MLDETNTQRNPAAISPGGLLRSYRALLSHRGYVGYVATISACYSVIFCFISGSSFVLIQVVGLTADVYGLCFAAMVIGYMSGTFISGRFGQRLGLDRMLLAGAAIATASRSETRRCGTECVRTCIS